VRQRPQPERSVLYGLVRDNLRTFLAQVEAGDRVLPRFVVRELEEYLRCASWRTASAACCANAAARTIWWRCRDRLLRLASQA